MSAVDEYSKVVRGFERALVRSCEHRPSCPVLHQTQAEERKMHRKWWRGNGRVGWKVTFTGWDDGWPDSMIQACDKDARLCASVDVSSASARTGLGARWSHDRTRQPCKLDERFDDIRGLGLEPWWTRAGYRSAVGVKTSACTHQSEQRTRRKDWPMYIPGDEVLRLIIARRQYLQHSSHVDPSHVQIF